jgi:hypothetical protein
LSTPDACIEGAALAPLTAGQKRELLLLALGEWKRAGRPGDFDAWRHQMVAQVTERHGLREMRQEEYLLVKAHLERLAGKTRMAERHLVRAAVEPRRVAMHKLEVEFAAVTDVIDRPREYVESIARSRYKVSLADCGEKQIWVLLFDLRRNAHRRRKKTATAVGDQACHPK